MRNRKTMLILLALGVILLAAAAALLIPNWQNLSRMIAPPPQPEITPPASLAELATQYPRLAPLLTNPELGSIYKEFLLAYEQGGKEAAMELARQRGLLTTKGDVSVTLILDTEDNSALVAQLESIGVTVVSAYRDRVNIAIPMELVESSFESDEPGAILNQLTELEHVIGVKLPPKMVTDQATITGEGVAVIGADNWHRAGFTGAGVRIGVLDMGFAGYERLLGTELPDNVEVATFGDYNPIEVHGTACAEIIHEIAPDAQLFFAWYDGTDATLGEGADWLASRGVHIISHSAGKLVGPRDGSEWTARLVNDLAARGVLWVNSAGNSALVHYRGIFTDRDGDSFHEFAPGDEMLKLENVGYVDVLLSWEDDWNAASRDLDLYIVDEEANELARSYDTQGGEPGQQPVEGVFMPTLGITVYAVVQAYDLDQPVVLDIFVQGVEEVEYPSPAYSVNTPADAIWSLTVGATHWRNDSLAPYSSQGPTTDGRLKPEISAPTGVSGHTYGREGFEGTSSSCPHVAGAAALVWQAHPEFTRQQVVDFLLSNALDRGVAGPDTGYGYGRLQLPPPPQAAPPPPPTPTPTALPKEELIPTPTSQFTPIAPPEEEVIPTPTSQFTPIAPPVTPPELEPTPTYTPIPTPTPVTYATPIPQPPPGVGATGGVLPLTAVIFLGAGLCFVGAALVFVGIVGLIVSQRALRRQPPAPPPAPARPAPPPGQCPNCGATVRAGARFCVQCGRPLQAQQCPYCGAQLRAGARFCPRCGRETR